MAEANVRLRVDGRDAVNQLNRVNKAAGTLQGTVGKLVGAFAGIQAAKFVFFKTAELETQTRSLKVLTGSLGNAQKIIKELQQFGAVTPFTSSELIETAKRLKAFGFETEKIVDVTKRLGDIAGATGADLGGIATAFGQIQAKGRLQGEELLQLQERGVDLQGTLRKEYGLTAEEFQKALSKGQIGADAVTFALEKLTEKGGKYAGGAISQSDTLSGKFSTLQDNIDRLAQQLGEVLAPVLKEVLTIANQALSSINRLFQSEIARDLAIGRGKLITPGGTLGDIRGLTETVSGISAGAFSDESAIAALSNDLKALQAQQIEVAADINKRRVFGVTDEEKAGFEALNSVIQTQIELLGQRQKFLQQQATKDTSAIKIPELLTGTDKGKGVKGAKVRSKGKTDFERQQEAAGKLLKTLKERQTLATALTNDEQRMLQLRIDQANVEERFPLLSGETLQNIKDQLEALYAQENTTNAIKKLQEQQANAAEEAARKAQEDAKKLEDLYKRVGSAIESGIVNGIMSAIDGTKSLQESLAAILQDVGSILLQFAVRTGLNSLNPTMFPMAGGGYVSGPTPALIGEGGESEYVIPESKMRESMARYSRGARGASVIPGAGDSGTSGEGGGTAVAAPIDVRFTVERINSVDYVTADQFQTGMRQAASQGAKQGEQQTLKRLQMSGSTRKRLGL